MAQKEDYVWLGGYNYDNFPTDTLIIEGYRIDFNKKPFQVENNIDLKFGMEGNNASISDKEGNLLFYTNGCAVMNKNYRLMPNGDSINSGEFFDLFRVHCSVGYPGPQDVLIINDPYNQKGYYLFHKPNIYYPQIPDSFQLHYTYVDMNLDGGLGDVVVKNKRYVSNQNLLYSYFTGIKHQNKKDWWLIQPLRDDSIFLTFLINENGINRMPDQNTHQYFDGYRSSASGTARFSPDGSKYALYNYYDQLHVYDFDRATGTLSNHKKIEIYPPNEIDRNLIKVGSVEWSPNNRFIYTSSREKLHQIDLDANDLDDAITLIDTFNGTKDPFSTTFFLMVQGPDCRIYMTPTSSSYSIHVINKPDELGTACDFVQNGIKFLYPNGGTLPNFPRFRVDEEDKCDPTITSIFGEEVYYRRKLETYPNPSYGNYIVKLPQEINRGHITITNNHGQIILQQKIQNYSYLKEIDLTPFTSGRYNIEIYPEVNPDRIFYGVQVVKL